MKIESRWDVVKISDFIEIIGGGTPDTNNPDYWDGNIPWLSVVDFNNGNRFVDKTEKSITEKGLKNSSAKYINAGDLIISARGTVGALGQLSIPMTFNQSCYGLRGNEKLDNGFLYYILKAEIEQLKNGSYGTIFKAITTKTFDDIKIPLPPIEVQQKIVTEIEIIEEKETQVAVQISEYQKAKERIIEHVLRKYPKAEIGKVATVLGGKRIPKGRNFSGKKTEYPYIRVSDFKEGSVSLETLKYIEFDVFEQIKNYTISKNDVYISIAGTIGLVGLIPKILDGKSLTENAAKIVIDDKLIMKEFLYYCLSSNELQMQIKNNTKTVGVPKLALKRIETLTIPLPSLIEQQKIVSEIEALEKEIVNAQRVIDGIPEQKIAVLGKYL